MFDYKLIEAMAMVARERGFDKAARKMHLTQSAVSQRVKLLEEQTGQVLIARTTPPRATPAGQKLLKHYLQVKRLEDDLAGEMVESSGNGFSSLAVGVNADSLATWFPDAIRSFLAAEGVLLDIRVDDQELTHRLLKVGDVVGCISTRDHPMQGCRMEFLGCMFYRMLAAPEFAARWFPDGLDADGARRAPVVIFNRKDELHHKLLLQVLGEAPSRLPTHYVPSSEKFMDFIQAGLGHGMLPDLQSAPLMREGRLVDLAPGCHARVKLFWHCWNLKSTLLEKMTKHLIREAKLLLEC